MVDRIVLMVSAWWHIYTPYNHCFYIYACVFMQSNLVLYQFMQSLVTEIATITCFTVTLKQHYLKGLIKQTDEIKIHYSKGVEGHCLLKPPGAAACFQIIFLIISHAKSTESMCTIK